MAKKEVSAERVIDKSIFDLTKAGYTKPEMQSFKNYYTLILNKKRSRPHKVVTMKPKDFLDCGFFPKGDVYEEYKDPKAYNITKQKPKLSIAYIDLVSKKAFGHSKAHICIHNKINEMPVLVVGATDKEIEAFLK